MKKKNVVSNKEYSETNKEFLNACKNANVAPSRRQASKFKMGKGKAYKVLKGLEV